MGHPVTCAKKQGVKESKTLHGVPMHKKMRDGRVDDRWCGKGRRITQKYNSSASIARGISRFLFSRLGKSTAFCSGHDGRTVGWSDGGRDPHQQQQEIGLLGNMAFKHGAGGGGGVKVALQLPIFRSAMAFYLVRPMHEHRPSDRGPKRYPCTHYKKEHLGC